MGQTRQEWQQMVDALLFTSEWEQRNEQGNLSTGWIVEQGERIGNLVEVFRSLDLVPMDHPNLGRYVWKAACNDCGAVFGGYEFDYTDPMKHHGEVCSVNNEDTNEAHK